MIDITRKCTPPKNIETIKDHRFGEWLKCASRFSKECTDCLCKIHSMRKILEYQVPCCYGECKGTIYVA